MSCAIDTSFSDISIRKWDLNLRRNERFRVIFPTGGEKKFNQDLVEIENVREMFRLFVFLFINWKRLGIIDAGWVALRTPREVNRRLDARVIY